MNKKELVSTLAKSTGMQQGDVEAVVAGCFKTIADVLCRGERITIRNFGSFAVRKRAARLARNMASKEMMEVPEHCVVDFAPSENFAKIIRENENLKQLLLSGHNFKLRSAPDPNGPKKERAPKGKRKKGGPPPENAGQTPANPPMADGEG